MADPISIAGSAVGLAATIGRVVKDVEQFMRQVREARADMDAISRELWSVRAALEMLADDVKSVGKPDSTKSGVIVPQTLEDILKNCGEVTERLDATLKKYNSERLKVRVKYVWSGKETINGYRSTLAAHKGALDLAVDLITLSLTREVKKDTEAILEETGDIKLNTENILAEIHRLQAQLPQGAQASDDKSDFILRKYLDELTSYAGSVVGDGDNWLTIGTGIQEITSGGDEACVLQESYPVGAAEPVRPNGSAVRYSLQQAERGDEGRTTLPLNLNAPREIPAPPSLMVSSSLNQAERDNERSTTSPPRPKARREMRAPPSLMVSSSLNQADSQTHPRGHDEFIRDEGFEHIGLERLERKKGRESFVQKFISVRDSEVGPRYGTAYQATVDYIVRDLIIEPILPERYKKNNAATVKWIRQFTMSGGDVNKEFSSDTGRRFYAIIAALALRDSKWLDYLLKAGADVVVTGPVPWVVDRTIPRKGLSFQFENTPALAFSHALAWDVNTARRLLQAGAKPSIGRYSALVAVAVTRLESLPMLEPGRAEDYLIYVAKFLLENGAEVNPPDLTPLHVCIWSAGYASMVRFLLDNGADPNQVCSGWGTPLHAAITGDRFHIIKILADAGAKRDATANVMYYSEGTYHEAALTPVELANRLGKLKRVNQALDSNFWIDPGEVRPITTKLHSEVSDNTFPVNPEKPEKSFREARRFTFGLLRKR